jgi:Leucine-rich repeat (LRR) protein
MKRLLFFLLLISFRQGIGQTYVFIPDPNFATCLQIYYPSAMNGQSLNITSTLVTTETFINVTGNGISNLNGIQYFTSLQTLYCNVNPLTSLPQLPNTLITLGCNVNSLTSLPQLPATLQNLECNNNYLNNLPTLPNSLKTLYCNSNSLINLPILPNGLKNLTCESNSITNLPILPTNIDKLYCGSNYLTNIPSLNSIRYLSCKNNSITSLPNLPNSLLSLDCSYNTITSLPSLPNSLYELYCQYNNISCFPTFPNSINPPYATGPNQIKYSLDLASNPFTCLPNYISAMSSTLLAFPICTTSCTAGLEELSTEIDQIIVYPNPSLDKFTIETNEVERQKIELLDINGKLILKQEINSKENINVSNLNNGVYLLKIKNGKKTINKKIIVAR